MNEDVWADEAWAELASLVAGRTGLAFPSGRRSSAEAGIRRAMVRAGLDDPAEYRALLDRDREAFDDLMVELTVGETYFFRDPAQFDFIRREVLPDLRRRRGVDHVVRAWSAGCASGEEAYSLAILLGEEGEARARVHATDLSRSALAKARAATYGAWSLRGRGTAVLPYLRRAGDGWVVRDRVRDRVEIGYLNLAVDAYPSFATGTWAMDLILCRNVLIYFDLATVARVGDRLLATLADGGWLITGPSDPPLRAEPPYETVVTDAGVFYRRGAQSDGLLLQPPAIRSRPPGPGVARAPLRPTARQRVEPCVPRVAVTAPAPASEAEAAVDVRHVRTLANSDPCAAADTCALLAVRLPLSAEVQYLWGVLLAELERDEEAVAAVRRALYLDASLAAAHIVLGTLLRRRGDGAGARRAYRNARDLCAARPADEPVPLADGACAGRLAAAADAQLALLGDAGARP